jgi:hypothetical protein
MISISVRQYSTKGLSYTRPANQPPLLAAAIAPPFINDIVQRGIQSIRSTSRKSALQNYSSAKSFTTKRISQLRKDNMAGKYAALDRITH